MFWPHCWRIYFAPLRHYVSGGVDILVRCDLAIAALSVLVTVRVLVMGLAVIRHIRKTAKRDCLLRRVSVSVLPFSLEHLGSDWTDLNEIWHLSIFRKSVEKIHVSLKPDKNNGCFTWRPCTFMIISLWILLRMKNVAGKIVKKIKGTLHEDPVRLWLYPSGFFLEWKILRAKL